MVARRIVAIVQARTTSTRLPRKVLAQIGGVTMVERMLRQLGGCQTLTATVVATSTDASDNELAELLESRGVNVFRGDLQDVLGRYSLAAEAYRADVVVRLTGDCPLHSPDTVDEVVQAFLETGADYANNAEPYTRPDGLDVEVFSVQKLRTAAQNAKEAPDREHVTPYLRRDPSVRKLCFRHTAGPPGGHLRWTVDEPADLEFARKVWARLDQIGNGPHTYEVIMSATQSVEQVHDDIANRGYYKSIYDAAAGSKATPLALTQSEEWLARSARVVPGGAQTYSKSWKQHIRGVSPTFLESGSGAWVWDVDGNRYVDLIQGLLPNILGYANPSVDQAVQKQVERGHSFSLAHPLEVLLAERLTKLIPCAEMVRFGKNGSDATAGAVRVARAFTGRERVAVCGYHGWQDWYIGTTSRNAGVPAAVQGLSHTFPYNDLPALEALLAAHLGEFACIVMEPYNYFEPAPGYLEGVREITHRHGALLVFDEICSGFHFGLGGAQRLFGVSPDLATFGKAIGNGYPISCIVGRRDVMQVFDDVFVSFTFAGDAAAMAAAMAVLDVLEDGEAYARIKYAGQTLRDGATAFAEQSGLGARFRIMGRPNWCLLRFQDEKGLEDPVLKTLWVQEVTRRGVLILASHNICSALGQAEIDHVLKAYAEAFKYIGGLVRQGIPLDMQLDGSVPTPAFRARG